MPDADTVVDEHSEQLKIVLEKLAERVDVRGWMRLGEFGFQEWLTEPDLYADDLPTR